jgi:uncharacterized delta-60 repeat protein
MYRFLWSYLFNRKTKAPQPPRRKVRPSIEPLEERALLTAGLLDPTFGTNGLVSTGFQAVGQAVAVDHSGGPTDGDIVVAGVALDPVTKRTDFALARYLPNGDLDPNFGNGGKVVDNFSNLLGPGNAGARAVAVQPDGKIVVAGFAVDGRADANAGHGDFAIARYNPDGTPDQAFGSQGKLAFDFTGLVGAGDDQVNALAIDGQNRIVVAGAAQDAGRGVGDVALARLTPSGGLDLTFGGTGTGLVAGNFNSTHGLGEGSDFAAGLAITPDGGIVIAGAARDDAANVSEFLVGRYLPGGGLDDSFGSQGVTLTGFAPGSRQFATAVAVAPDDSVVAAGAVTATPGGPTVFGLARYTPAGRLDPTFGSGGTVTTAIDADAMVEAVRLQADGKIVAAGPTLDATTKSLLFAVARYNAVGTTDGTFGPTGPQPGVATAAFAQQGAVAQALAIQADGKIVVAGTTRTSTGDAFAVARFLATGDETVLPPLPPAPHRLIFAQLVPVKIGRRRENVIEVFYADTGALRSEIPLRFPQRAKGLRVDAVQGDDAGLPDEVVLTGMEHHRAVSLVFPV